MTDQVKWRANRRLKGHPWSANGGTTLAGDCPFNGYVEKMIRKVKTFLRMSSWYRVLNPRRLQLYCAGTAKSGTHSITAIFEDHFRSAHEPEAEHVITLILDLVNENIHQEQLHRFIIERDRKLWLEVDSSQLNYFLLEALTGLFQEAKFILTIRDPISWLDSIMNHELVINASPNWRRLSALRFRTNELSHPRQEGQLKQYGLHTLDGYLSYWAKHNQAVLSTVPAERLLVVRTHELAQKIDDIARFAGVSVQSVNREKSHASQAKTRFNMLARLDLNYLEEKIAEHCRPLMVTFFPEIKSVAEVLAKVEGLRGVRDAPYPTEEKGKKRAERQAVPSIWHSSYKE